MFKAFVLVRNVGSSGASLDFGEFTIGLVGPRFTELREVFESVDVGLGDWILEKPYIEAPLGASGDAYDGIPADIEDLLVLLRLYQVGDIAFVKLAIYGPHGTRPALPYRAMNDLNNYSPLRFEIAPEKCRSWKSFADGIREGRS